MHKLRIEMQGPGRGRVWLDEKAISATGVKIDIHAGQMNRAVIELNVLECEFVGEVDASLAIDVLRKTSLHLEGVPVVVDDRLPADEFELRSGTQIVRGRVKNTG